MILLGNKKLNLIDIENIVYKNYPVGLSENTKQKISRSYKLIKTISEEDTPVYGINTGFGALAETAIKPSEQAQLQKNIILSHAVGVGAPLSFPISKTLTLLRLNTLVQGHSGASLNLLEYLLSILNANCAPLVPKKGSVGASGDLAPLAHLGLLCLGLGNAMINGRIASSIEALRYAKLKPLILGVRDGLALINGTQAMSAVALFALREADFLLRLADITAATTLIALLGHKSPFDERIHALKPHKGQILTA